MPKVTVVIPTYNSAHFLDEAIQSVLAQTFTDFEVVVVDDGSTDNTKVVVDSFKDPRIKYVYQQNQGPPGARNKGVELSMGEYIFFLDSDDSLLEHALVKSVEVLDSHLEAGISYGQAYITDDIGRVVAMTKARLNHSCVRQGWEELRDYLLCGCPINPSTVMIRRS
jgi:glycosyltransferase involved in cell wall biosynthesis